MRFLHLSETQPNEKRHPSPLYRNPCFFTFSELNHTLLKDGPSPPCSKAIIFQAVQTATHPVKEGTPLPSTEATVFYTL